MAFNKDRISMRRKFILALVAIPIVSCGVAAEERLQKQKIAVAEEKCSDQMERAESNTNDVLGERMSATYSNPWYLAGRPQQGPSEYRTDAKPLEYRGFQIFERIPGKCWDVVKDGTCVTQRAGLDGAKRFIDAA